MSPARWISFLVVLPALLSGSVRAASATPAEAVGTKATAPRPEVTLTATDRVLVLAPHPDDEVLACGGILQQAVALRLPVRTVFLTYGDNNQWSFMVYRKHPVFMTGAVRAMGEVRHGEALAAGRLLGLAPEQLTFLGYPDFGTLHIWAEHWNTNAPFHSMFTRAAAVPYADAFRPGAPHRGDEILRDLTGLIREFRPTRIFVSHSADHNGDHRALYLFTRVALWDLEPELHPELLPYLVHYKNWPRPRGLHIAQDLAPPAQFADQIAWKQCSLSPAQVETKHAAMQKHASQYKISAGYLLSFVRRNELFGDFPDLHPKSESEAVYETRLRARTSEDNEPADELTQQERDAFVGLVWRYVYRDGDHLVFTVELSRPLARTVQANFSIFGYRHDRPFPAMPKIRVVLGEFNYDVYDQNHQLPDHAVAVRCRAKEIEVRVPLKLLGDPERVLASARTYLADIPLDWVAWRALDLR